MVEMSRFESSDDSSSDSEDNGNFKRRRRGGHHDSDDDSNDYQSFDIRSRRAAADSSGRSDDRSSSGAASRGLKVYDRSSSRAPPPPAIDDDMIVRQRLSDSKANKLCRYDDVFAAGDTAGTNESLSATVTSGMATSSTVSRLRDHSCVVSTKRSTTTVSDDTAAPISRSTSDPRVKKESRIEIEANIDHKDLLAGGDSADVMSSDPRLRRQKKFDELPTHTPKHSSLPLRDRIHRFLITRKPMEAYNELKQELNTNDVNKYKDQLIEMAKDWFPSIVDNEFDAKSMYVENHHITGFQNLMKDVFQFKIKSVHFWDTIIIDIGKFIDISRIRSIPQLLSKLRFIMINNIRDHLVDENIKLGIKASNIMIDARLAMQERRDSHRRQFEATIGYSRPTPVANKPTVPVIPMMVASKPSLFSDMIPNTNQRPVIQPRPVSPPIIQATIETPFGAQSLYDLVDSLETNLINSSVKSITVGKQLKQALRPQQMQVRPQMPVGNVPQMSETMAADTAVLKGDKIIEILQYIRNDQYLKLINMMNRHITHNNFTIITDFGRALGILLRNNPKASIIDIFRKIHDTLKLNNIFGDQTLNTIFEKFLKEFSNVTQYNAKEWLLFRECTVASLPQIQHNPYNEKLSLIKHNVVCNVDYGSTAVTDVVIDYENFNREVPLMASKIAEDPRVQNRVKPAPEPKPKTIIKFSNSYDTQELKKIVRKVNVSSDEESDD